jgi:hypothetical protein
MIRLFFILCLIPSLCFGDAGLIGLEANQTVAGGGGDSQMYTDAIAIWDFENDATDTKGTYDLTANSSPTYGSTSPPQGSYYATLSAASSQYFSYADNAVFDFTGDFAISYWIKRSAATSNQHAIGKYADGEGWRVGGAYHSGSDYSDDLRLYSGYGHDDIVPGDNGDFITTNWQCITWSYNDTTDVGTVWISESSFGDIANGTTFSSMSQAVGENTAALVVGGYDTTHTLTGNIDEVVVWGQTLNATNAEDFFDGDWR